MATPLIPYINIPSLPPHPLFGWLSIKPFGTLVALGVFAGTELAQRHAKRFGLELDRLSTFVFSVLVGGFTGGHMFDALLYHPDHLREAPWTLFYIWESQSSFGGFTGAFLGLLWFWRKHPGPVLPYADVVGSAFPLGWLFGRMGCTVAHDHVGIPSDSWLAVAYPMNIHQVDLSSFSVTWFPGGGRFDLGFLEVLFTLPLMVSFVLLARKPRPPGFFIGIMCTAYAPIRFALDFLRVHEGTSGADGDLRYGGLTPAQWGCFVMLAGGVYFTIRAVRSLDGSDGGSPPAPPPPGGSSSPSSPAAPEAEASSTSA